MIFYTVDLDEKNNRIKGTARLLGKTSNEGSFYPEGCFVETYIRIKNKEKTFKNTEIKMSEWRENPFCDDINELKK